MFFELKLSKSDSIIPLQLSITRGPLPARRAGRGAGGSEMTWPGVFSTKSTVGKISRSDWEVYRSRRGSIVWRISGCVFSLFLTKATLEKIYQWTLFDESSDFIYRPLPVNPQSLYRPIVIRIPLATARPFDVSTGSDGGPDGFSRISLSIFSTAGGDFDIIIGPIIRRSPSSPGPRAPGSPTDPSAGGWLMGESVSQQI